MGKKQNEWARKARLRLIDDLGGECVRCGETDPALLSFDHIDDTRRHITRNVGFSWRISIYRKEAKQGLLQLLCVECNTGKGKPPQMSDEEYAEFLKKLEENEANGLTDEPDTFSDDELGDYDPGKDPF